MLGFFLDSFTMLLSVLFWRFVMMVKNQVKGSDLVNFADFLSLTNVSILLINTRSHAYYIHGECHYGSSEMDQKQLVTNLENEQEGYFKTRGLILNDPHES